MSAPRVTGRALLPNCEAVVLLEDIAQTAAQYGPDIASRITGALSAAMEAESDEELAMALHGLFAFAIYGASGVATRHARSNAALVDRLKRRAETLPGRFAHKRQRNNLEAAVEKTMADLPGEPTLGRAYAQRVRDTLPPGCYSRKDLPKGTLVTPSVDTVRRCVRAVLERQGRV
jgi:hypothetical protein